MGELAQIETELDELHQAALAAFARCDLAAYADGFCPDLEYRQTSGVVIGKSALMQDVASQFRRLTKAETSFVRDEISRAGEEVTETVTQTAVVEASAFGFFHRSWSLSRRGQYTWRAVEGSWKIAKVHVLSEDVISRSWRFGR